MDKHCSLFNWRGLRLTFLTVVFGICLLRETNSVHSRSILSLKKCTEILYKYNLTGQLSHEQLHICKNDNVLFHNLSKLGIGSNPFFEQECQYWMADERWNCTGAKAPLFPGRLQPYVFHLTKETAFVQALMSALAFIWVARGCAEGRFPKSCSCMKENGTPPANSEWDSCMHNTAAANQITQKFLDKIWDTHSTPDDQRLVHIHNLEAGRRAVTNPENYETVCKCHGMTYDCKVKTCHRRVKHPRRIGQYIKEELYQNAEKVQLIKRNGNHHLYTTDLRHPLPKNLVFTEDSPSYCNSSKEYAATGVSGRECINETSYFQDRRGLCSEVCCNGFERVVVTESYICHCTVSSSDRNHNCHMTCTRLVEKFYCI